MIFNRLPPSGSVYCYATKALRRHFAPLSAQTVVAAAPDLEKKENLQLESENRFSIA